MSNYSDKELLEKFREGEESYAFNLIVRKYQTKVYWHIRRIIINHDDADDVTQNTFIKAYHSLTNFREDAKLFTWLYRIATNESLTFLKQQAKQNTCSIDDLQDQLSHSISSDKHFTGDEIQLKLQQAILNLPEKQRLIFNMKYYDELKYEEIADILNVTVGGLKANYHHAVKKIEEFVCNN